MLKSGFKSLYTFKTGKCSSLQVSADFRVFPEILGNLLVQNAMCHGVKHKPNTFFIAVQCCLTWANKSKHSCKITSWASGLLEHKTGYQLAKQSSSVYSHCIPELGNTVVQCEHSATDHANFYICSRTWNPETWGKCTFFVIWWSIGCRNEQNASFFVCVF